MTAVLTRPARLPLRPPGQPTGWSLLAAGSLPLLGGRRPTKTITAPLALSSAAGPCCGMGPEESPLGNVRLLQRDLLNAVSASLIKEPEFGDDG